MRTVSDLIRLNARRNPGGDAVVDASGRLSHGELAHRAWGLARGLAELGVRPGDRVGVLGGNSIFTVEAFLGAAAAGAVFVPYNWRWSTPELVAGVNETRASVVLVEDAFRDAYSAAEATGELASAEHVVHQGAQYEALFRSGGPIELDTSPEDPLCILFTGGTTGFSKGVVLSHRAALANAINENADCGLGQHQQERGLIITPMFHSAALLCWFVTHYLAGKTSVFMHKFDEDAVAEIVSAERITNLFLVPNMIRRLLNSGAFESDGFQKYFRAMHSGAGLLRMPDKQAFSEVLPDASLYFRYGLTEAGPMVTRLQPHDMLRAEVDGSIGKEYLLVEAQVQDESGHELEPGRVGEICVRGPSLMTGYFGRQRATEEVFRGGWLRTGDLASRDQNGYFYFHDRAKDMIKTGGENVYSAEIEQVLYTHPAVQEAAVIGVPSTQWDEEVRAIVSLRPGHELTEAGVQDFVRRHLAGYKVPKHVAFLEAGSLPRTPAGKLLKRNLRDQLNW
ncbi:AMP-binding protein [Saccharopolyspora erythraea]|uniref:class I adenylate-forming enzyme family protein n=1 Tax=Saccharopolyspora erythraea TaxID=1836 RepID=UPI001BA5D944|nr:AMP-binding protein [Saccharopolyspora erythraea]QUH01805.1 AMP-binding protein [Saccharopolyspora erythraea]